MASEGTAPAGSRRHRARPDSDGRGKHRAARQDPAPAKDAKPRKGFAAQTGEQVRRNEARRSGGGRIGRARSGAAAGATAGPEGAAAGAIGGLLSGGGKKPRRASTPARKVLVGEFLICSLIVALSPLTDKHKLDSPATFTKRAVSTAGVFLVLSLVSTAGKGAQKVAAAFGALVTVTMLVSNRDLFVKIAERFNADDNEGPAGPNDTDAPEATGSEVGAIGAGIAAGLGGGTSGTVAAGGGISHKK